ncbi:hypothetical protein BLNAU_5862 [Blattamonas nauphoetae]|uniref:Uncharacterized protein n=1 Tax=Blattamonas nauphoetae TaxID=2049346 RepID=A0ABQ9Y5P0_9EUKA|nr:hypothetical protein BLNAU_5862 [Blattamonas nauphoetae]
MSGSQCCWSCLPTVEEKEWKGGKKRDNVGECGRRNRTAREARSRRKQKLRKKDENPISSGFSISSLTATVKAPEADNAESEAALEDGFE